MKNLRRHIIPFLMLICGTANAQFLDEDYVPIDEAKFLVCYDLTYLEDTTASQFRNREQMDLFIGDSLSLFISHNLYRNTLMKRQKQKEGLLDEWLQSEESFSYLSRFKYRIFKNLKKQKANVTDYVFLTGYFQYEEDLDSFDWEIHDDTVSVNGFLCQKATCRYGGRNWEAWFAEELPFGDGPYKFCGLPGLILQLRDTEKHYCFDFVSIEVASPETKIEWELHDYASTSKMQFFKVEDELRENIMSHFDALTSGEVQKKINGVMQSRNNPIELERK